MGGPNPHPPAPSPSGALLGLALLLAACSPPPPPAADPGAAGKWRTARSPAPSTQEAPEALLALPYLQGYRKAGPGDGGAVTLYDKDAACDGLNLYTSGDAPEARLIDMAGRSLARWRYPLERFRPELYPSEEIPKLEYFRRARLLPGGDLLAIYEGLGLIRLSPRSELRWGYRGGAHHDLDLTGDSTGVWVLDREATSRPELYADGAILEDFATELDLEDGHVRRKISILRAFERSPYAGLLARLPSKSDLLHTNTIERLDGTHADAFPAFTADNLLISVLELDTVAVLDPAAEKIVWAQTGPFRKQHQPTLIAGGRLLVFDNRGLLPAELSRVVEIDPRSGALGWQYGGAGVDFFSRTLGTAQRLPNGNTLITESENGRAFEVEPGGRKVWQFDSPHRAGPDRSLVAVLFEMERLPRDFPYRPSGTEKGPPDGDRVR